MVAQQKDSAVRSILRAFEILELFRTRNEWNLVEIIAATGLSKSTCHEILTTLTQLNVLGRDEATKRYHLGRALIELGSLALNQIDIIRIVKPFLKELRDLTDETVILGVLDGDIAIVVDKEEPDKITRLSIRIGKRYEAHATAFGRVLLAALPEDKLEKVISHIDLSPHTPASISELSELKEELGRIRVQGFAVNRQQYVDHVCAVAVPIFGHDGQAVASLSTVWFDVQVTEDKIREITSHMVLAARDISIRLGARSSIP